MFYNLACFIRCRVLPLQVSDAIARHQGYVDSVATKFISLQMALYIACFICVIGGGFFLATALFIRHDRGKVDKYVQGMQPVFIEELSF